jgi:hypothetical protein
MLLWNVLVAAAIAVGGCGEAVSADSNAGSSQRRAVVSRAVPVALHLSVGSYSITSSTTTINGTATRGSRITVNGHRAVLHGTHWSAAVKLHVGENRLTIRATLRGHRPSLKTITVTREESSAELEAQAHEHEAEARQTATSPPTTTTTVQSPEEAGTNGTYVNSAGNTVCRPEKTPSAPAGATAECTDGTYSFSESRSGTCSHHGGVARWL